MSDGSHNELPSLKVGQVWQCRDQRRAKVVEGTLHHEGRVLVRMKVLPSWNGYQGSTELWYEPTQELYHGQLTYAVAANRADDSRSLVALLYDPDVTTQG